MTTIRTLLKKFDTYQNDVKVTELNRIIKARKMYVGDITRRYHLIRTIKLNRMKRNDLYKKAVKTNIPVTKNISKKQLVKKLIDFYNTPVPATEQDKVDTLREFGIHKRVRITIKIRMNTLLDFYNRIMTYIIKMEDTKGIEVHNIVLYYKILNIPSTSNKHVHTTVDVSELESYEAFEERIIDQEEGNVEGSDARSKEEYELNMQVFDMLLRKPLRGHGKWISRIYNTVGIESNGYCGYECLKILLKDELKLTKEEYDEKDLSDMKNLIKYIKSNKLRISIIADTLDLKEGLPKKIRTSEHITIRIKGRRVILLRITNEDNNLIYLYNGKDDDKKILYNYKNKHYDVMTLINNNYTKDIYATYNLRIFEKIDDKYKLMKTYEQNYKEKVELKVCKQPEITDEYIILDYEGVTDFNKDNVTVPYSLAFLHCTYEQLEQLSVYDEHGDDIEIQKFIGRHGHFKLGYDCTRELHDYMTKYGTQKRFTIVTFNGVNYDNLILYHDLKRINSECVGKPFYSGTRLMNFRIWGIHDMFDIRKHVVGSLKKCCKDFQISTCAKQEFSHIDAQKLYDKSNLIRELGTKEKYETIKKYNMYDVLSLGVLFYRYRKTITDIKSFNWVHERFEKHKTLGTLMMSQIKRYWKRKNIHVCNYYSNNVKIQEQLIQLYDDLNKYKSGGRVQLFNGIQKIFERMASADVCSMYPFVMMIYNVFYPTGDIKLTKKYKPNKIGFYYCDVDQRPLRKQKIPMILCEKTNKQNNWDTTIILKDYLISSVKIEQLLKYKANVTIKHGFYFDTKIKSYKMFKPLIPLMQLKNIEDSKKTTDQKYNNVLRETLKAMMNVTSGKLIEGLHLDTIVEINNYELLNLEKNNKVNILDFDANTVTASYTKKQAENMKNSKPIHLGILIYDYAQQYMYDHQYSKYEYSKNVYTDTDSNKIRYPDFKDWVDNYGKNTLVPHWEEVEKYDNRYKTHPIYKKHSKVFGSFEDEYHKSNYKHYFLQKKAYLSMDKTKKGGKMTFKGVNYNNTIIYENPEGLYIHLEDGTEVPLSTNDKELFYNYAYAEKLFKEGYYDNREKLFEMLYDNKKVMILTQYFRRSVKNTTKNISKDGDYDKDKVNENMNTIMINTRIKTLKI